MATQQVTPSMQAHAQVLLERSKTWARGHDTRNGRQFVIFTSSRCKDGQPVLYYTGASGDGCTCPSFLHRGACSHAEACRLEAEAAREAVGPKLEDLMSAHQSEGRELVSAF